MRLIGTLICLASLGAAGARAQEVRVISPRPDSVSVTIYRDLFALITETRTVDLPGEAVTLVFDGVVDTLIPQSAIIGDTQRAVAESNFDFDRLTPASLLQKSIGNTVLLTRTNRDTGQARQVAATVIAANRNGVVFRTADGNEALHCTGFSEKLTFESIPDQLQTTPRLSIRLAAGTPGKRQVRISYLAQGFAWSANYVANLDGERMDLAGWITLRNLTDSSFRDAEVQLVAGRLNLLDAHEERGTSSFGDTASNTTDESLDRARASRLEEMTRELDGEPPDVEYFSGCYPLGAQYATAIDIDAITAEDIGFLSNFRFSEALQRSHGLIASDELMEIVVTGFRSSMAVRENLADYQLYRLPVRTDLHARQTKQVSFLRKPDARVERFYALRLSTEEDYDWFDGNVIPARIQVAWRNRVADGLGEPLPGGIVRFFERHEGRAAFAGDARLADNPLDAPAELSIGKAIDLGIAMDGEDPDPRPGLLSLLSRRFYLPLHLRVINAKPRDVVVEIRQGPIDEFVDLRVRDASLAPQRKAGDYLWRLTVPAGGESTLSYRVGGRIPDDE